MKTLVITVTCSKCRRRVSFSGHTVDQLDENMVSSGWRYTGRDTGICPKCDQELDEEYMEEYIS